MRVLALLSLMILATACGGGGATILPPPNGNDPPAQPDPTPGLLGTWRLTTADTVPDGWQASFDLAIQTQPYNYVASLAVVPQWYTDALYGQLSPRDNDFWIRENKSYLISFPNRTYYDSDGSYRAADDTPRVYLLMYLLPDGINGVAVFCCPGSDDGIEYTMVKVT